MLSMGGVLTATLWQNKKLNIDNVIFDGTPLILFSGIVGIFFQAIAEPDALNNDKMNGLYKCRSMGGNTKPLPAFKTAFYCATNP